MAGESCEEMMHSSPTVTGCGSAWTPWNRCPVPLCVGFRIFSSIHSNIFSDRSGCYVI